MEVEKSSTRLVPHEPEASARETEEKDEIGNLKREENVTAARSEFHASSFILVPYLPR